MLRTLNKDVILVLLLALPMYPISKWLEQKLRPRRGAKYFLLWVAATLTLCLAYFAAAIFVAKLIDPALFAHFFKALTPVIPPKLK